MINGPLFPQTIGEYVKGLEESINAAWPNGEISSALDCIDDGVIWGDRSREDADYQQASFLAMATILYGLGWPV